MSEIVESSAPSLKKLGKNKILLFGGLGAVAGIVVLAMKGAGKQQAAMVAETGASGDQAVSAMGSQLQAFEQGVSENQASISAQVDALVASMEQTNSNVDKLGTSLSDYQSATSDSQQSIVDQLVTMQQQPVLPQTPYYAVPTEPTKTVYGQTADLNNAKAILGSSGYTFVDTTNMDRTKIATSDNDIRLGGTAIWGTSSMKGTQIGGYDAAETASLINNFNQQSHSARGSSSSDNRSTAQPTKTVYGQTADLNNAKAILGSSGYTFVDTTNMDRTKIATSDNDIRLGGTAIWGTSSMKGTQIGGYDAAETAVLINNFKAGL